MEEPLRLRPQKDIVFKPINSLKRSAMLDYQSNCVEESCITDAEQGVCDITKTEEQMKLVLLYTRLRLQPDLSLIMPNKDQLKHRVKHHVRSYYWVLTGVAAAVVLFFGMYSYWAKSEQELPKNQVVNVHNDLVTKSVDIVPNVEQTHSKKVISRKNKQVVLHLKKIINSAPHEQEDLQNQKEHLVYDYLPPIEDQKIQTVSIAIARHQSVTQQFTQAIANQSNLTHTEPYTIRKLVAPLFAYSRKKRDQATITHLINNENYGKQIEISADTDISQPSITRYYSSAGELMRTEIKINN